MFDQWPRIFGGDSDGGKESIAHLKQQKAEAKRLREEMEDSQGRTITGLHGKPRMSETERALSGLANSFQEHE